MKFGRTLLVSAMAAMPIATNANAEAVQGLYIAGSGGITNNWRENFNASAGTATSATGNVKSSVGPAFVLSLGWGFGNGLRAEVEGSYRANVGFSHPSGFGSSTGSFGGQEQKAGVMVNAFYDFVNLVPWAEPFVGVGVGYQEVIEQNLHGIFTSGGNTLTFTQPSSHAAGSFAYQAMIGMAIPIPAAPGLAITLQNRFMGLAGNRSYTVNGTINGSAGTGTVTSTSNYSNTFLVGFRYAFNAAPPPAAPMPMADTGAKTFLVFFDWNKSDITSRAQGIIQDAAGYSTKTKYTRIDVDGNTDTSGSANYNMGLSERRARVVAAELVRLGVPQSAISMHAYGETKLLVPTGPNVREPQNRRVDIVYH